ncbi:MAG: bifunctional nuclease family protein [Candidatus Yanofskybacteria bacterium]|nr:bifunctional nuclease family protein [Candidatus Yanofskybacteria bacterium]
MWSYALIVAFLGIFIAFLLYFRMNPVCPVCGDNLNSRRRGFFGKRAVCRLHGYFDANKRFVTAIFAPALNEQGERRGGVLRELMLNHQSLITVEDPKTGIQFIILLYEKTTGSAIPIFSDQFAYFSIAAALDKVSFPRPLTHDLFKNTLEELGCELMEVIITEQKENTYFANLCLDKDGQEIIVDSRPSDAIALALRFGSPILIGESLFLELLDDEYNKNLLDFIEKNQPSMTESQEPGDSEDNSEDDPEDELKD